MTSPDHTTGPQVRKADQRGQTQLGWLQSFHSFSFGRYHDPQRTSFGPLRVLNDDVVAPGQGFAEHSHANMEILTWVLSGRLRHQDSLGHGGVLAHGDLQVMTAGRGIRHSEFNDSDQQRVHFLQIWIEPRQQSLPPAYSQFHFEPEGRANRWQTLICPTAQAGALTIAQDVHVHVTELAAGQALDWSIAPGRRAYLHLARGQLTTLDTPLQWGDALACFGSLEATLSAERDSEVLLLDLP